MAARKNLLRWFAARLRSPRLAALSGPRRSLILVSGTEAREGQVMESHPFANNAKGWGTGMRDSDS